MRTVIVHTHWTRRADWSATLGNYKHGDPIGHGLCEADSVYDLYMQLADLEDAEEAQQEQRWMTEMGT